MLPHHRRIRLTSLVPPADSLLVLCGRLLGLRYCLVHANRRLELCRRILLLHHRAHDSRVQITSHEPPGILSGLHRYGDLLPKSDLGKLITCAYVLVGISFIGSLLGLLAGYIMDSQDALMKEFLKSHSADAESKPDENIKSGEPWQPTWMSPAVFILVSDAVVSCGFIFVTTQPRPSHQPCTH